MVQSFFVWERGKFVESNEETNKAADHKAEAQSTDAASDSAADAQDAKAASGAGANDEAPEASKEDKPEKRTLANKLRIAAAVIAGVIVCVILVAPSIAGYLYVSVISDSGTFTGQPAQLSLYEGDVTALLVDDDPSNDPEPKAVDDVVVGQRARFDGMGFQTYTVMLSMQDETAASQVVVQPKTVSMWGIDMKITYNIA